MDIDDDYISNLKLSLRVIITSISHSYVVFPIKKVESSA